MGQWTQDGVPVEPILFDGDEVRFTLKRLLVEDMERMAVNFDTATKIMRFENPMEACKLASNLIPKYVLAINGCKKANGIEMTLEEFREAAMEFYFVPLLGQLFARLVTISVVGKEQEKN